MRKPQTRTPAARRGFGKAQITRNGRKYTREPRLWKTGASVKSVPLPLDYYSRELGKLSRINHAGWAQARCPFHDDGHASLSVQLSGRGGWRCFAGCGSGDLISFHMKRTGLNFSAALRDLTRRA